MWWVVNSISMGGCQLMIRIVCPLIVVGNVFGECHVSCTLKAYFFDFSNEYTCALLPPKTIFIVPTQLVSSDFCMTMRHMTSQILLCFYCQMKCEKCRAAELDLRQSTIVCFCWLPHNRDSVIPIVLRNVLRKFFSVIYIHTY